MKKSKRILALVCVVLLLFFIVITVIGAFTATPNSAALFQAGLYSIIVVPIMIYGYMLIYRLLKKNSKDKDDLDAK
jgi:uncharacterized BrkB/YihY/UPF0761 family membrane protein